MSNLLEYCQSNKNKNFTLENTTSTAGTVNDNANNGKAIPIMSLFLHIPDLFFTTNYLDQTKPSTVSNLLEYCQSNKNKNFNLENTTSTAGTDNDNANNGKAIPIMSLFLLIAGETIMTRYKI